MAQHGARQLGLGLGPSGAARELTGVVQPIRLLARLPWLLPRRPGPGRTVRVLVLPGRGQPDLTTIHLRSYLWEQGFRVQGWGLGRHRLPASQTVPLVVERLVASRARCPGPVALVGQSLGGFVAREVARQHPELVDQVITIGAPLLAPRSRRPLDRPVTAIWSRRDQVVPPMRALDPDPSTEHVEVRSTHFAIGLDPDVWAAVAERLARGGGVAPCPPPSR